MFVANRWGEEHSGFAALRSWCSWRRHGGAARAGLIGHGVLMACWTLLSAHPAAAVGPCDLDANGTTTGEECRQCCDVDPACPLASDPTLSSRSRSHLPEDEIVLTRSYTQWLTTTHALTIHDADDLPGGNPELPGYPKTSGDKLWAALDCGDFDGDDDDEIVMAKYKFFLLEVDGIFVRDYLESGAGAFSYDGPKLDVLLDVAAGDFNGDGDDEIVVVRPDGILLKPQVRIIDPLAGPAGAYDASSTDWVTGRWLTWTRVTAGDFDGDGDDEIVLVGPDQSNPFRTAVSVIDPGDPGPNGYRWTADPDIGDWLGDAATGDFDGDGVDELAVVRPYAITQIYKLPVKGSTGQAQGAATVEWTREDPNMSYLAIGAGDLDGDGDAELVLSQVWDRDWPDGDQVEYQILDALDPDALPYPARNVLVPEPDIPWHDLALGDLNGDGYRLGLIWKDSFTQASFPTAILFTPPALEGGHVVGGDREAIAGAKFSHQKELSSSNTVKVGLGISNELAVEGDLQVAKIKASVEVAYRHELQNTQNNKSWVIEEAPYDADLANPVGLVVYQDIDYRLERYRILSGNPPQPLLLDGEPQCVEFVYPTRVHEGTEIGYDDFFWGDTGTNGLFYDTFGVETADALVGTSGIWTDYDNHTAGDPLSYADNVLGGESDLFGVKTQTISEQTEIGAGSAPLIWEIGESQQDCTLETNSWNVKVKVGGSGKLGPVSVSDTVTLGFDWATSEGQCAEDKTRIQGSLRINRLKDDDFEYRDTTEFFLSPDPDAEDDSGPPGTVIIAHTADQFGVGYCKPQASLKITTTLPVDTNEEICFDASDSTEPQGENLTYAWDWNYNGTFTASPGDTGETACHTYGTPGTYRVAVRVTDAGGNGLCDSGSVSLSDLAVREFGVGGWECKTCDDLSTPSCDGDQTIKACVKLAEGVGGESWTTNPHLVSNPDPNPNPHPGNCYSKLGVFFEFVTPYQTSDVSRTRIEATYGDDDLTVGNSTIAEYSIIIMRYTAGTWEALGAPADRYVDPANNRAWVETSLPLQPIQGVFGLFGNAYPVAALTASPSGPVCPDEEITFDANGSSDPEGSALTYHWIVDGLEQVLPTSSKMITRSFRSTGNHFVRVSVEDACEDGNPFTETGLSDDALVIVTVKANQPPNIPTLGDNDYPRSFGAYDAEGATSITVQWTDGDPDVGDTVLSDVFLSEGTNFQGVDLDNPPPNVDVVSDTPGTSAVFNVSGADNKYYWRVRATDSCDDETHSHVGERSWNFSLDNTPPEWSDAEGMQFAVLNVNSNGHTITCRWEPAYDPSQPVTYDLYREAGYPLIWGSPLASEVCPVEDAGNTYWALGCEMSEVNQGTLYSVGVRSKDATVPYPGVANVQPNRDGNTVSFGVYATAGDGGFDGDLDDLVIDTEDLVSDDGGGTYTFHGSVTISPGDTLTIPAGTTLKFARNVCLNVYGTLIAHGTEEDPIIFTGELAQDCYWYGITASFDQSGGAVLDLKWCKVRRSRVGIQAYQSDVTLEDCEIQDSCGRGLMMIGGTVNVTGGRIHHNSGSGIGSFHSAGAIADCEIDNNGVDGIEISNDPSDPVVLIIDGCLVHDNTDDGIGVSNPSIQNFITDCRIYQNEDAGIEISEYSWVQQPGPVIDGNPEINTNKYGIACYKMAQPIVRRSAIRLNYVAGVYTSNSMPDLGNCNNDGACTAGEDPGTNIIAWNGQMEVLDEQATLNISAEGNWWGVSPPNPALIAANVDFNPWLAAAPQDVGDPSDPQVGNPGFEGLIGVVPEGWRWFHSSNPTGGFAVTQAPGGAPEGVNVVLLNRSDPDGDSALDKDTPALRFPIAAGRVYKLEYAAQASMAGTNHSAALQWYAGTADEEFIADSPANVPDAQSSWEYFGLSARAPAVAQGDAADATYASIGFWIIGTGETLLDDVRLDEVTYNQNRLVNGSFDNSALRAVNWSVFNTPPTGANYVELITTPGIAYEGPYVLRMYRGSATSDFGIQSSSVAVKPAETIQVSLAARRYSSLGGSSLKLKLTVTEYDSGAPVGAQDVLLGPHAVPPAAYLESSASFTMGASTDAVTLAIRIVNSAGAPSVGDYLLDAISVIVPANDCNGNGADDADDIAGGVSQDCNGNGTPDECDIVFGSSSDCQPNGIPDDCETDCNSNNIPDDCDISAGLSSDCQRNGTPDECEPDCDGDDIPDGCEIDCDLNGTPDDCETVPDCNTNGRSDVCDVGWGFSLDLNGNGVPDECEPDCNTNGQPDDYDISSGVSTDCDGNGTPDLCDLQSGGPDCNSNGWLDACDLAGNDCDSNGQPDECQADADGDLVPDPCDVCPGFNDADDTDGDGIPDACDRLGDVDHDSDIDLDDYSSLSACLGGPGVSAPPQGCAPGEFASADLDGDGDVDLGDFALLQQVFTGACGNGFLEGAEECDDGGESVSCDINCTAAWCGDGTVNATSGEACDAGGESPTCDTDCTFASCGDGTLNATAGEECDAGGESATCDIDCTAAVCGDGTLNVTAGEECDDGGESATCDANCTFAVCGDGTLNVTAGEECDDGGESATCDANCTFASCGDGTLNPTAGEQCDDGNQIDGDGCSSTCQIEAQPLPECVIPFGPGPGWCPNIAPVCGALFAPGGGDCVEYQPCATTPPFAYRVEAPFVIALGGDLNRLSVMFSGFQGTQGVMQFFDALGAEVGPPLFTNGDCQSGPPLPQYVIFSRSVRTIQVTAMGGPVWIDTFHVNPP
ncbi:MAG: PKD domain-containing protein [Planctomycetota bacterium]